MPKRSTAALALCLSLLAVPLLASAESGATPPTPRAGTLDRSFSTDGLAIRGFGPEPTWGTRTEAARTPAGNTLLLVGARQGPSLVQLLPDGSLDPSFGNDGFADPLPDLTANAIAIQPDGKILLAGGREGGRSNPRRVIALARYAADGTLDRGFGNDGILTLEPKPAVPEGAEALVVQPDGKMIVISGESPPMGEPTLQAIRLRPDGSLDRSYGQDGYSLTGVPGAYFGISQSQVSLRGETLTVMSAGQGQGASYGGLVILIRLGPGGDLDPSLGGDGIVSTDRIAERPYFAPAPDGRMVVFGSYRRVMRFLPDGSIDRSFGSDGLLTLDLPRAEITSVAVREDGGILLAGRVATEDPDAPHDLFLSRLTPDGAIDPGLGGGDGFVATDVDGGSDDKADELVPFADGRIMLVGESGPDWTMYSAAAALYEADGSLDPAFGRGGIATVRPRKAGEDAVADLLTDRRGGIVAAGRAAGETVVARYLPDGRPDQSFADGGFYRTAVVGTPFGEQGESLARYGDGRLLVGVGSRQGGAILRLLANGRLDRGFGHDGVTRSPHLDHVLDLRVLKGGRILVAGTDIDAHNPDVTLARLTPAGRFDPSFGADGTAVVRPVVGARAPHDLALAIAPSGRIFVGGNAEEPFVAAFSPGGRRLKSFGWEGEVELVTMLRTIARVRALSVDRSGRILVAGSVEGQFGLARLQADGTVDRRFGEDGSAMTAIGPESTIAEMRLEPDGGILAAGASRRPCYEGAVFCRIGRPLVARFTRGGSLDRRFARHGIWTARIGESSELNAIAIGGKTIVAGGWTTKSPENRRFLVLRLHR